jgi:hypothetical protein
LLCEVLGGSDSGRDLTSEILNRDLAIPHDEHVCAQPVHVVGGFCRPHDLAIVALDGLMFKAERCAGFSKVYKQRLEERFDP